jgi:hypothetical protein
VRLVEEAERGDARVVAAGDRHTENVVAGNGEGHGEVAESVVASTTTRPLEDLP